MKGKYSIILSHGENAVKDEVCKRRQKSVEIPIEFEGRVSSIAHDLSRSGMLCRTSRQIAEMTLLEIQFALPGMEETPARNWVKCSGVVVSCEKKDGGAVELPYELSIFFNTMSEEHRKLLSEYVEKTS